MSSLITREIRQIYKAIEDTNRRLASMILNGPVAAIDGDRVQLELEPKDDRTGKPFLSPWVQVQEAATKDGATATHFPVAIGDPMRLLSPNGELGPQSFAIRDSYTDPAANPTDKKATGAGRRARRCLHTHGGRRDPFRGRARHPQRQKYRRHPQAPGRFPRRGHLRCPDLNLFKRGEKQVSKKPKTETPAAATPADPEARVEYEVTELAGHFVAGRRNPGAGGTLLLTAAEASFALSMGQLLDPNAPKPAQPEA